MRDRAKPAAALCVLAALAGFAAPSRGAEPLPDGRLGLRTAPILLLSRPDVRADLGLDESQTAEAERAITELYVQAAMLRGRTGKDAQAARRRIDAEQERWLEAHLSQAQLARLVQIDLQWEGPSALISRPKVQAAIGLNEQQVSSLTAAVVQRDNQRRAAGYNAAVEARLARTALSILTKPQQDLWKNMLGDPYRPQLAQQQTSTRR